MAIRCARSTFLAVAGKNAPAFTVASLAMIMCRRPAIVPMPQTTPAAGAPPHSAYISQPAHRPSSSQGVSASSSSFKPVAGEQPPLGVLPLDGLLAAAQRKLLLRRPPAGEPVGSAWGRVGRHGDSWRAICK